MSEKTNINKIQILDCTLRDGGYCNKWRFGFENAKKIVKGLIEANIEIIECGFLTNKVAYDKDATKFTSIEQISKVIPDNRCGKLFVVMMNYGEYNTDDLPYNDGTSVDGIRVAYHKKDQNKALEICKKIQEKGYLVFVQAMVSLSYSDEEFLNAIKKINELKPYSFYIVDSFGMMKGRDLARLFYLIEHNLIQGIMVGFHSHNNMQLAFSNAQRIINENSSRELIIDTSVFGMGRGAGNLNTELFIEYLNECEGKKYNLKPILALIDEILNDFYQRNYWGYSLPNYISAVHNAHPNYAGYLDDKKTLTIENMNDIFDMMDDDKKVSFDKQYIEELYIKYMERHSKISTQGVDIKKCFEGRSIVLIAPGKSSITESDKILKFIKENDAIVIGINHEYSERITDYIFVSNLRRFRNIPSKSKEKCIVTSNITTKDVLYKVDYGQLLNKEVSVADNAGLMAIKFLILNGVTTVYLAGFDGYSHEEDENYAGKNLAFVSKKSILDEMNVGMKKSLIEYSKLVNIVFITETKYQ